MTTYSLGFDIWARDRASQAFDKLSGSVDKTESRMGKMKTAAVTAAATAGAALTAFAVSGIDDAARVEMAVQRVDVLFGKNSTTIKTWAEGAAQSIGMSEEAALTAAGQFGNMFQQLGFGQAEAAKMSTGIVELTADLAAFNGLPTDQVIEAMSAAFRGEYDALQRVIPGISAARIESEALSMTGKKTADSLTQQEKAAAVLAIVQKDGAAAAGYFADNQDKLSVKSAQTQASMANLRAEIGSALVPAMSALVGAVAPVLSWLNEHPKLAQVVIFSVVALSGALVGLSVAAQVMTAAQIKLNLALLANPIVAVIALIIAMGVALVALYRESETFRRIVHTAFGVVKTSALAIYHNGIKPLWNFAKTAFAAIANAAIAVYNVGIAPLMRLALKAFASIARGFADLLRALSKVPGFGWAADAAAKMDNAASKADRLRGSIVNIPAYKGVDVVVRTTYKTYGSPTAYSPKLPYRNALAEGGRARQGELTLVGEEGPELWVPKSDGMVVDADTTARMLARGRTPGPALGGGSKDDLDYLADRILDGFRKSQREHARELLTLIRAKGA